MLAAAWPVSFFYVGGKQRGGAWPVTVLVWTLERERESVCVPELSSDVCGIAAHHLLGGSLVPGFLANVSTHWTPAAGWLAASLIRAWKFPVRGAGDVTYRSLFSRNSSACKLETPRVTLAI